MKTVEMVRHASQVQDSAIQGIMDAIKAGDSKALSESLKIGSKAAFVVVKGTNIAKNADKYETAAQDAEEVTSQLPSLLKSKDAYAKAQAITRLNSARRKSSALRKVEEVLAKIS